MLLARCFLAAVFAVPATATGAPVEEAPLEEVVVTGEFPGPGMWKVTRADDPSGHVLWIVGDPALMPRRLKWKSAEVESVAVGAQEILLDSTVNVVPDEKIGIFRGLSLLPAALSARKNPDDARLHELLPADVYERWRPLKQRFLGRDAGVEKWRPIFAAHKLREEVVEDLKLREGGMVRDVVLKLAKKHEITTTTPQLKITFPADGLKARIREFSREALADTECFVATLDLAEALSNREIEEQRARAWATADLAMLDSLPPLPNPYVPCSAALLGTQFAREVIPADFGEQLHATWLAAAEKALGENPSTLAIVPFGKLTRADGYLARLQRKGYLIEPPQ